LFPGFVHFFEGVAEKFFAFAVTGGGIEIVYAFIVCGSDERGAIVDVVLVFESHCAETYSGDVNACFAVLMVNHILGPYAFLAL